MGNNGNVDRPKSGHLPHRRASSHMRRITGPHLLFLIITAALALRLCLPQHRQR